MDGQKRNTVASGLKRNDHDWYTEPPFAVHDLFDAETFQGGIWDPCCGRGTIPYVCGQRDYPVVGTDLVQRAPGFHRFNFLDYPRAPHGMPNIVCNPPFLIIDDWMRHVARLLIHKAAIFAPITLLNGGAHSRLLRSVPFACCWAFTYRVPCPPGEKAPKLEEWTRDTIKGTTGNFGWFILDTGFAGRPHVDFLPVPPADSDQAAIPGLT
jgi:hypothetical protein